MNKNEFTLFFLYFFGTNIYCLLLGKILFVHHLLLYATCLRLTYFLEASITLITPSLVAVKSAHREAPHPHAFLAASCISNKMSDNDFEARWKSQWMKKEKPERKLYTFQPFSLWHWLASPLCNDSHYLENLVNGWQSSSDKDIGSISFIFRKLGSSSVIAFYSLMARTQEWRLRCLRFCRYFRAQNYFYV